MVVCVEGPEFRKPTSVPCPYLIEDSFVAYACGVALDCPTLSEAKIKLDSILGKDHYLVYQGGHHIAIHRFFNPKLVGPRVALLVEPNDKELWIQWPELEKWCASNNITPSDTR